MTAPEQSAADLAAVLRDALIQHAPYPSALAALDALAALAERAETLESQIATIKAHMNDRCEHLLARAEKAEAELALLAEVAADSNEREKLLEAELARLIEMHERIANLDWPEDGRERRRSRRVNRPQTH